MKKKLVWVFKGVWVSVGQCGSVGVVGVFKGNPYLWPPQSFYKICEINLTNLFHGLFQVFEFGGISNWRSS